MKLRTFGMTAAVLAGLAVSGVAAAQGEWMHGGHMGMGMGPMAVLHGLNLTDEQKTQVRQIMAQGWASEKPLMEKMRAAHEAEMTAMLGTGAVTAETLQPTMAAEESLRQRIDAIHMNTMLQVRAILTSEQLAQAASKHAQIEQLRTQEHEVMGQQ